MNLFQIGGILVIAVGTILLTYGSQLASKIEKDDTNDMIERKIGETLEAIENVQSNEKAQSKSGDSDSIPSSIMKIEGEFTEWANDLLEGRGRSRIQVERSRLDSESLEIVNSGKLRPLFDRAIGVIRGASNAYGGAANLPIETNLPDVPENIYREEYRGSVTFPHAWRWVIRSSCNQPAKSDRLPALAVNISGGPDNLSAYENFILILPQTFKSGEPIEYTTIIEGGIVPSGLLPWKFDASELDASITELFKRLFELQIDLIDSNDSKD